MNTDRTKAELRAQFSAARRALSDAQIAAARAEIVEVLTSRWASSPPARVAAYIPLRTEPGSRELLDALVGLGCAVLLPVLLEDNDLGWTSFSAGDQQRETGEMAPLLAVDHREAIAGCDVVLVPALAVAEDGTRLGRGGGSYDRALARVTDSTAVVALLYDDELVPSLPRDTWDRPVNAALRPTGWIDLPRLDGE